MEFITLYNKEENETFLRRYPSLYLYHLGDLDEFYYPYTDWYGLKANNNLKAIILLYKAVDPVVVQALSPQNELGQLKELLESCLASLPNKFYAHLSPGTEDVFKDKYKLISKGEHFKMILKDKHCLENTNIKSATNLFEKDITEIRELYNTSYPENFFDSRMLKTRMYYGIRLNNKLVSIAGIHTYSQKYRVAALGNITTLPDYRGNGYGTCVTVKLCKELLNEVDVIGLNVGVDNLNAIKSYENIGFRKTDTYHEYLIELKQ